MEKRLHILFHTTEPIIANLAGGKIVLRNLSPTLSPTYDIINMGDKVGELLFFIKEKRNDE
jgi:predicted RNA-binding protein with PUA domain